MYVGAYRGSPEALQIHVEWTVPQWLWIGHRATSLQPHHLWTALHAGVPRVEPSAQNHGIMEWFGMDTID